MPIGTCARKAPFQPFALGQLILTSGAKILSEADILACLKRHASGDFGSVCEEDFDANLDAIRCGDRILSAYECSSKRVFVITEADRSATTMLLAEEY